LTKGYAVTAPVLVTITDLSGGTVFGGDNITYTLTVINNSGAELDGVIVSDPVPAGLTNFGWGLTRGVLLIAPSPFGNGPMNATVNLAAGGVTTFDIHGTITPAVTGTLLTNTVTVTLPGMPSISVADTDTINTPPR